MEWGGKKKVRNCDGTLFLSDAELPGGVQLRGRRNALYLGACYEERFGRWQMENKLVVGCESVNFMEFSHVFQKKLLEVFQDAG